MFKSKSREVIICTYCGKEIDACDQCNIWFGDDEEVYCDEVDSHYCKNCGLPRYKKYNIEKNNSTLGQFTTTDDDRVQGG